MITKIKKLFALFGKNPQEAERELLNEKLIKLHCNMSFLKHEMRKRRIELDKLMKEKSYIREEIRHITEKVKELSEEVKSYLD